MPEPDLTPQKDEIERHITHLTRRWGELAEPCLLEVVHLSAEDKAQVKQVSHYSPDEIGLSIAADDIATWNAMGINCYATVNPVSATNRPKAGRRASAEHIIASFFHFADADSQQAADNIRNFVGPKPTFVIITGQTPCVRPHVYWELEDPTRNLDAWSRTQAAISDTLKTDRVIDPPRIMRIGGTVNWPKPQKKAKGYKPEITLVQVYDREPVTSENMARAFAQGAAKTADTGGIHIDTGPQPLDRERERIKALSGEEWNNAVFRLVGSYVARGDTDGEIHALTDPLTIKGYTVEQTREEVADMIRRTRENPKFEGHDKPKAERPDPVKEAEENTPSVAPFKPWEPINPLAIPRREFVYGKHYIRKFASVTVAPGGLGKSTLVLAECIAIASGRPILGVHPASREKVVYFNAEDPVDEINRRVVAMCQLHNVPQEEIAGWLFTASGRNTEIILSAGENGDIVEAAFKMIEDFHASTNAAVYAFDPLANMTESPETNDVFRRLGKRVSRLADALNCSIEIVHHTRKLNGKEAEIEDSRGGGALIGAVRAGRVLNPMTAAEAAKSGLDTHIDHFRIEAAGKSNLARPAVNAEWYKKVGVELANGDWVAALEPWQWPDAFEGVTAAQARDCRNAIMGCDPKPRQSVQAADWAGRVIAPVLGLDPADKADKARLSAIIKTWIETDVLAVEHIFSSRDGRDIPHIIAGKNDMSEASA